MNNILGGSPKTPWHLWVVGILTLLWNSGGIISYSMTKFGMLDESAFPSDQLEFFAGFPAWASAFWALGVWGAFLGSLALLFRSRFAVWLFVIALIGLSGTTYYQRVSITLPESMQTTGNDMFAMAIWVITLVLLFYSIRIHKAGILR